MNAEDIKRILATRHPLDEGWVYLTELRTKQGFAEWNGYGAGLSQVRSLDAFAMHTWHSKGFRRMGYEVKVARSDWLGELKNYAKHMQGYYLTHEFWYAVAEGVYKAGDTLDGIEGCGILEVSENGEIRELRRAYRHSAWPMPETFIASLLNQAMRSSAAYAVAYAELDAKGLGVEPIAAPAKPKAPECNHEWRGTLIPTIEECQRCHVAREIARAAEWIVKL